MAQVPFLKFLLPMIGGILFYNYTSQTADAYWLILPAILIGISFVNFKKREILLLRYTFGIGFTLLLFILTLQYCDYRTSIIKLGSNEYKEYIGRVLDFPQRKPRSMACEVQLLSPCSKKVLLYFELDSDSETLRPGDEIILSANIEPFKNRGNPDRFDYARFMFNRGFTGSAFVKSKSWHYTGRQNRTVKTKALLLRKKLLDKYRTLNLEGDEYSFITALTLGYKAELSDELKNAFSSTGTSHILAVSGLHVGFIYIILSFVFSFLNRGRAAIVLQQLLVVLCLWGYAFITGLSISVLRAAIMLTIFCVGQIIDKKGFTYNSLSVAAFFILVAHPFYLFDLGFQLSFASVFSILFFQPKLSKLYIPERRVATYIWNLFTVSIAAQLGVFPIILYYFGSFPVYFFITNLLVLPLVAITIYGAFILLAFSLMNFTFVQIVIKWLAIALKLCVKSVLKLVYLFESLPLSSIEGNYISFLQLILLFTILYLLTLFFTSRRGLFFIGALSAFAVLSFSFAIPKIKLQEHQLIIYNSFDGPNIAYNLQGDKVEVDLSCNKIIPHPSKRILFLKENITYNTIENCPIKVDCLILSCDNTFSIAKLLHILNPQIVVLDASLSRYVVEKLQKECNSLGIVSHDISVSGAYSLNF